MLEAPPVAAEWVAGMCRTIRLTWFTPDMGDRERRAWIEGYWTALNDMPEPFVRAAWEAMLRKMARRPSPAEIRMEAERLRDAARDRLRHETPRPPPEEPNVVEVPPERREKVAGMLEGLARRLRTSDAAKAKGGRHVVE